MTSVPPTVAALLIAVLIWYIGREVINISKRS